jgi:alpha-D-ribose 1-methylphosphonate 5-triphosphate synthase subunit PhnH
VFDTGGLHPTWLERREVWVRNFPLGVDFILIKGASVAALPRTTRILKEDSQ